MFFGKRIFVSVVCALCGAAWLSSPAFAWGPDGHRMIGELAMQQLPQSLPGFLRSDAAAQEVGYLSPEPDRERGAGKSFDSERGPAHFVDVLDDLTIGGGPKLSALPPSREAYDTALRAVGTDQYKMGYLPYSIVDGFELITKDLAYWRVDKTGEALGKSAAERAWYAKDRVRRQAIVLHDIGLWSHFVGDGSQPLHVTVHYNGWGPYPNPEGFTQEPLHVPFENEYVHGNVTEAMVGAAIEMPSPCGGAILDCVEAYLRDTQRAMPHLYALQKQGAFADSPERGAAFTAQQIARGAAELSSLIAAAWNASDAQSIGYPPVAVRDVEDGKVDPYQSIIY